MPDKNTNVGAHRDAPKDPPDGKNPKSAEAQRLIPRSKQSAPPEPKVELTVDPDEIITPDFVELQEQLGEQWLEEIKQEGLRIIFENADLPDVVKRRIMRKTYRTPEAVRAAIQEAHEELQELEAEETIDLGQRPYIFVEEPRDQLLG